ncbi:hypothetical protein CsSME_00042993 [Camellia sinensis var. sinensis]
MSLPPLECICVTEESIREWKNGNPSFKAPNPVPVLRFLYELCWTVNIILVLVVYGFSPVRGELPFQKCKAALDSVDFLDKVSLPSNGDFAVLPFDWHFGVGVGGG